jgi:hypothetical protein
MIFDAKSSRFRHHFVIVREFCVWLVVSSNPLKNISQMGLLIIVPNMEKYEMFQTTNQCVYVSSFSGNGCNQKTLSDHPPDHQAPSLCKSDTHSLAHHYNNRQ